VLATPLPQDWSTYVRRINQAGLDLLKSFEKCVLSSYKDQGGVWTIGWGHTGPEVVEGMVVTPEQANAILEADLEHRAYPLEEYLRVEVTDNQYSALCCLVYNIGLGAFRTSSVLKAINANWSDSTVLDMWRRWDKVHGEVSKGLDNRRQAEIELWGKHD